MKVTMTFESLEEFWQYMSPALKINVETPAEEQQEKPKRGRPKKTTEPEQPAAPEVPAETQEEAPPFEEDLKPAEPAAKEISLTAVRAVCLSLSKAGKQTALKEAFGKFGAKKLSDVAKEDYPALMIALGEING